MNWCEILLRAENCAHNKESDAALLFVSAIECAQSDLGAYHPDVAKCFLSYAKFLEGSGQLEGARLNYKLAAAIFAIAGEMSQSSSATEDGVRMDRQLGLAGHSRHPISNELIGRE